MKKLLTLSVGVIATSLLLSGCSLIGFVTGSDDGKEVVKTSPKPTDTYDEELYPDIPETPEITSPPKPPKEDSGTNIVQIIQGIPSGFPSGVPLVANNYLDGSYLTDFLDDPNTQSWALDVIVTNSGITMVDLDNQMKSEGYSVVREATADEPIVYSNGVYYVAVGIVETTVSNYGFTTFRYVVVKEI